MKGFLKQLAGIGITTAEFGRRSEISFLTLKKIDAGLPVSLVSLTKAQLTLEGIKAEAKERYRPQPKASGIRA